MAVPGHHTPADIPYTPSAFSVASTGAAAFQTWLEEEEEEWRLAQRLEANCPKEFMCPISLDIMSDPVILLETGMTYDRHNIRKWLLLGGSNCPLTGVKLVTRKVVSHKHLRQRIEAFRVAGGVLPAESGASAADPTPLCGSELSYQVLTQGVARSERAESHTQLDSPRAESIATFVGRQNPLRRKVWMFERAPSEVSSTGGRRQRIGHVGAPRRGPPAPEAKPNVSRSSLLLCKFSSSALSRLTSGGSMAMSPLGTPRSAIEEGDEAASPAAAAEGVDLPGGSRSVDLPAAQSSDTPKTIPGSLFKKLSGNFTQGMASAPEGEAPAQKARPASVAEPARLAVPPIDIATLEPGSPVCADIPAPPSTPKTPVAEDSDLGDESAYPQHAGEPQTDEDLNAQVGAAHLHEKAPADTADRAGDLDTPGREDLLACMDQTMLAEAHAAMMTIENAGNPKERPAAVSEEGQSGLTAGRELGAEPVMDSAPCTDTAAAEESEGQGATDTGGLSAPQAEGEGGAQDGAYVLEKLEEALADEGPPSKRDPGASGGSTKSSSTISVIATADMTVIRPPRTRVGCLGGAAQPKRNSNGRRQVVPGVLHAGQGPAGGKPPPASNSGRAQPPAAACRAASGSGERRAALALSTRSRSEWQQRPVGLPGVARPPYAARSRAARQGGWARCFGCTTVPSLQRRRDCSGAVSRLASRCAEPRWVEGSDEEVVTVHDFARHVIAAAAKRDAGNCAAASEPSREAVSA